MPSSRYDVIPFVLDQVVAMQPRSILDIGIGYGKYGVLFREYLDIWKVDKPYDQRVTKIVGIEAFEEYRNIVWDVYDEVLVGNVKELLDDLSKRPMFDLLFMGDVIEHFEKEEAKEIIRKIPHKHRLIITPLVVSEQTAVYKNDFEIHKSSWKWQDFPGLNIKIIKNQQVFYG